MIGASMKKWETGNWKWVFFLYAVVIIRLIVFKYPFARLCEIAADWNVQVIRAGVERANFTLFRTIRMYIRYYDRLNSFENLFGNVLVFLPYGMLYPIAFRDKHHALMFLPTLLFFVVGIEGFQLLTGLGRFDVDDILLNCLGAVAGAIFVIAGKRITWYIQDKYR